MMTQSTVLQIPAPREEIIRHTEKIIAQAGILSLEEAARLIDRVLKGSGLTVGDGARELFAAMAANEAKKTLT